MTATPARYRFSQGEQSARFFRRPHHDIARAPLQVPAAWTRATLEDDPSWRCELTAADRAALVDDIARLRQRHGSFADLGPRQATLPALADRIDGWRRQVRHGRGIQLVRGLPVEDWSLTDAEWFFWCLGLQLGTPGEQNPAGDLLGRVTDTGAATDDPFVRAYETRRDILFHCDGADAVGLLCWQTARRGGASRVASSVTIYNEVLRQAPELVDELYQPFALDLRNDRGVGRRWTTLQPCCHADGELRTFYHGDYFRSVARHPDAPPLTPRRQRLLDLVEAIGADPAIHYDMELQRGDIQLVSNHTLVHARTAYEDWPEPARRRLLLRLWLTW